MKLKPCVGSAAISFENIRLKGILSLLITVILSACAPGSGDTTATPQRPAAREAVYVSPTDGELRVSLRGLQLLSAQGDPDTQVLVVLASGDTNPAYVLYPSNQPGVPGDRIDLADYPLRTSASSARVGLWAVALKHQAYPLAASLGQEAIADQLARGFDRMQSGNAMSAAPLAEIVAGAGDDLLAWFGEVDVLGEVALELSASGGWSAGENQVQSRDGGIALSYEVTFGSAPDTTPQAIPSPAASEIDYFGEIGGYRQVVHDDFDGARSTVEWFIGRDPTYSATIVNNAYQIVLQQFDEGRSTSTIWGSIQGLYFHDYIVRARVRVLQDDVLARYGLWLRYQDDFHFLFFGMENTGRYRAARFQTGYTELNPWTEDDIVNTGNATNVLEVLVDGDNFTMSINGEALVTVFDTTYTDGRIAFFCHSDSVPTTCHLEEIAVWVPEDDPFPKPTVTPLPESD